MIAQGLKDGTIRPDSHLIESSSGNFAIALATVARHHGLPFTCVVDPKICAANLTILGLLGVDLEMVAEPDEEGSFLRARLARVGELLDEIDGGVWLNQYENDAHWQAHYQGIAAEMIEDLVEPPDYLVVAVSSTGTIMGISRRLREHYPDLRVVAVDLYGSIIFGRPAGQRRIPGIGSSIVPGILDPKLIDEVVQVSDQEAIEGARSLLAAEAILAGGSSGAAVAAIGRLAPDLPVGCRILTVFPDRGERYLDTVYAEAAIDRDLLISAAPRPLGAAAADPLADISLAQR